jgi:hypothetical protein
MSADVYDDPELEAAWLSEQREVVLLYLSGQGAKHGGLPDEPAFFVVPYVAIWAVNSRKFPGSIGWWAVSGDLPTDYVSSTGIGDARAAMRAFSRRWQELADDMLRGRTHPDSVIGTPDQWPELGKLLKSRADLFSDWADDESIWT